MKTDTSASREPEKVYYEDDYNRVTVIPAYCKDCGICMAFCPVEILESRNGVVVVSDISGCTGCGQCELRCPDFAIEVEVKKRRKKNN